MLNIGEFARLGQVSPRMLRHYDRLGLLAPERVDPETGYRSYSAQQLVRLHRLLALRDLGFTLEQIGGLVDSEVPLEELRGMLRLRRAQLEQTVADERARLRRVEAHLRAIEGSNAVNTQDVVIKKTQPLRVAETMGTASGLDPEHIGPLFMRLAPELISHLLAARAQPGILVGYYDEPKDDGSVDVHVAYEIGEQTVPVRDGIEIVELPVVEVASVVHRGGMDDISPVYDALIRWIEDSGYQLAGYSRELYHEMGADGPSVTELQVPIAK
jgi:DNA-binding transcriptional MerR regulator/predicted transcriptional regulator YdeE